MSKLQTFRKKPVDVQALQFTGQLSEVALLLAGGCQVLHVPQGYAHHLRRDHEHDRSRGDVLESAPAYLVIETLEGSMRADLRDWVIRGVQGEFYPCKPDIFEQTYDDPDAAE